MKKDSYRGEIRYHPCTQCYIEWGMTLTRSIGDIGKLQKNVCLSSSIIFFLYPATLVPHRTRVAGYYGITLAVRVSVCLSYVRPSVFSFPDDNLSKYQWIFTKLGVCIDIVEI